MSNESIGTDRIKRKICFTMFQPNYNAPHYNAVFNIKWPCHGCQTPTWKCSPNMKPSELRYMSIVSDLIIVSLISWFASMDTKGSLIRLIYIRFKHRKLVSA